MASNSIYNIAAASLTLGAVLARGANGTTLYQANLVQGQRSFQVQTSAAISKPAVTVLNLYLDLLQVAVKSFLTAGASASAEANFFEEVRIAQLASATCQRACRILGCCNKNGDLCLVMSLYASSAAKCLEVLQGNLAFCAFSDASLL